MSRKNSYLVSAVSTLSAPSTRGQSALSSLSSSSSLTISGQEKKSKDKAQLWKRWSVKVTKALNANKQGSTKRQLRQLTAADASASPAAVRAPAAPIVIDERATRDWVGAEADSDVLALAATVPSEFAIVRYVTEAFVELRRDLEGCVDAMEDSARVEWQLFLTAVQRRKWGLAHALAEKLERQISFSFQQISTTDEDMQQVAMQSPRDRLDAVEPPSPTPATAADHDDPVLEFLAECAA